MSDTLNKRSETQEQAEQTPILQDDHEPDTALVLAAEPVHIPLETLPPLPPPRRRSAFRVGMLIAGALLAAGAAYWWWSGGAPPPKFSTVALDHGPITAVVTATGTINPVISVQVGSQVSGKIKALFADYNSVVTKGQVIAQIDPAPFQAKVAQAKAALRNARGARIKAEAALAQRKLELDRMDILRRDQFVAQADLDLARTNFRDAAAQVEVSQAQVDQATSALASAKLDLGYTTIYSPENGIVVTRNVDVGQTVAATLQAPTLFVIAKDLTQMEVHANVSESDIGGVTEGKAVEFTVDAFPRTPFTGTVVQVRNAPISIQNVVTYDVVIGVDNRDLKLKPGMTANVSVVTAWKDRVLRAPNTALRFKMPGTPPDRKKSMLWVLDAKGEPRAVPITPGLSDAAYTEVAGGEVREGDPVIIGLATEEEAAQKELPPGFGVGPRLR